MNCPSNTQELDRTSCLVGEERTTSRSRLTSQRKLCVVLDVTEYRTTSRIVVCFSGTTIFNAAERDANSASFARIKQRETDVESLLTMSQNIVLRQHTLISATKTYPRRRSAKWNILKLSQNFHKMPEF